MLQTTPLKMPQINQPTVLLTLCGPFEGCFYALACLQINKYLWSHLICKPVLSQLSFTGSSFICPICALIFHLIYRFRAFLYAGIFNSSSEEVGQNRIPFASAYSSTACTETQYCLPGSSVSSASLCVILMICALSQSKLPMIGCISGR